MVVVKNPPAKAGDVRVVGLNPGLGRFPGGGHDNPLQYSCLENPMDRGAWQATVHRLTKDTTEAAEHAHVCTLLYLKWVTKNLLYGTGNSAQCYVAAWMGRESGGEWT